MSLRAISANLESSTNSNQFVALCKYLALARGDVISASRMAAANGAAGVAELLTKSSVSPGTLSDPNFASAISLYPALAAAFASSLSFTSAFFRIRNDTLMVPLHSRAVVVSSAFTGATVGEGQATPVTKLSVSGATTDVLRGAGICVLTDQLLRHFPQAGELVAAELRKAISVAVDAQFVGILTAGVSPTSQSGTSGAAVLADLQTAIGTLNLSQTSRLYCLVSGAFLAKLSVESTTGGQLSFPGLNSLTGGQLGVFSVIPCDAVAGSDLVICDAQQVTTAASIITIDSSAEATVNMDSSPDSPVSGTTTFESLWERGLVGLQASIWFAATRLRAASCAVIS